MLLLNIEWGVVGVKAAQLILSFSILVVLHELGHFLPAKWFGCRVEKFYLFFNPWFSLFKKQVGETEYGIGWIPFGGYVKIAGMIDESMDKEQMNLPAQPWEFRSKPAWQRLIIMLGGVTVNVLLAIVIFIGIAWKWGDVYLPPQNTLYGLSADSLGQSMGIADGDIITHINGKPVEDEQHMAQQVIAGQATKITVSRSGQPVELRVPDGMIRALNTSKGDNFVSIRTPGIVDTFSAESNAKKAGIRKGDTLLAVDGVRTPFKQDVSRIVRKRPNGTVRLLVGRKTGPVEIQVPVNDKGMVGVGWMENADSLGFKSVTRSYTFLEAIPAGLSRCSNTLSTYLTGLKQLFTGKANPNDSVGSLFSFGKIFPGTWHWQSFWTLTAIFSIVLAFMNVLPIPALDGGHALFTIYEMITGRKPNEKFMERAQVVGMVLLLTLMAYALGLDLLRIIRSLWS